MRLIPATHSRRASAFTLVEMLVVLVIMSILAALLISKASQGSYKADIITCQGNLKKIITAFSIYVLENDGYAPYNPNSSGSGDNFWSWECLYLLGPYMDDPDHKKFQAGEWTTVRCPGNKCEFYRTGNALDGNGGGAYDASWQNRQAPNTWPSTSVVPPAQRVIPCSTGEQIVDYQYNVTLGGIFQGLPAYTYKTSQGLSTRYKVDFIAKYPSESVVFCDIHFANVLRKTPPDPSKKYYRYPYNTLGNVTWGASGSMDIGNIGTIRTNEDIHGGKGVNAAFLDGHVEFIPSRNCFGNSAERQEDDILNWGVSWPLDNPGAALRRDQVRGIHGFRMYPHFSEVCIAHEQEKNTLDCFPDGL